MREAFPDKPWTKGRTFDDGSKLTPLKPNDIETPEEWVMFNLFHELNHASFPRPAGMSDAIFENKANVGALKDLKIWRRTGEIPNFQPGRQQLDANSETPNLPEFVESANTLLTGMLNKVKLTTTIRLGKNFYDALNNPEVSNRVLKKVKDALNLPDEEAADIILAFKQILFKKATRKGENIAINRVVDVDKEISPEILEGFKKLGLSKEQIKDGINLTMEHYGPKPRIVKTKGDEELKVITGIDDDIINDIASKLSKNIGGGRHSADILRDKIAEEVATQGRSVVGFKENILSVAIHLASKFNSKWGAGKITGILDPHKNIGPNVIKTLQRRFSSEVGQEWTAGGVGIRDVNDFVFYGTKTFAEYLDKWKQSFENLQLTVKDQKFKGDLNNLIANGIRHGTSVLDKTKIRLTPEIKKDLVHIITTARPLLRKFGKEMQSKGILEDLVDNYFPRLWDRAAIDKNGGEFVDLILANKVKWKGKLITNRETALELRQEMLDITHHSKLSDTSRGSSSFFYGRTLEFPDDDVFSKFLDTDINSVLTSYYFQGSKALAKHDILGVSNLTEFKKVWGEAAAKEIRENGGTEKQVGAAMKDMNYLYQSITGEGLERFGPKTQFLADSYMLANRMALLPLSTLSSLTEIFINISKVGPSKTLRGYRDAIRNGSKNIYDGSMDELQKVYGLTRKEAKAELNQMGIALDQALADYADRLGGDALTSPRMRKMSNKFFRFTLLDQWTKTVQMTSYIVGRRLIGENLEDIMAHRVLIAAGKTSRRVQKKIDDLADLGIDYEDGIKWIENGAKFDDPFYRKVKEGAGAYTNDVILNPTGTSGLRPAYMSHPQTAILGQLLGYPAAFTNVVLKAAVKQFARNPETLPQHVTAAAIMTGFALLTNAIRSDGESLEEDPEVMWTKAFFRWGGNGLPVDMFYRGREAAKMYQNPTGHMAGLGPAQGDIFKLIATGNIPSVILGKIPGTGAFNAIFKPFDMTEEWPDNWRKFQREWDRWGKDILVPERERITPRDYKKGGEVFNVPQVPVEPDERIDKMTGLPYNEQAGGAFIDQEDRKGFALGTVASKAVPVLKSVLNEALDFLANKGENITVSRLGKRLKDRGVRKDEMESSGIDEAIEKASRAGSSVEQRIAKGITVSDIPSAMSLQIPDSSSSFYTKTRKGNIAFTPEGLRNLRGARKDQPLVESNFVTARETSPEHYRSSITEEMTMSEAMLQVDGWRGKKEDTVFSNLFEEITPKDVNKDTYEIIVFRDPRVKDTSPVSEHFVNINIQKGEDEAAKLMGSKYSYHVRFDQKEDALRIFEMQTDLMNYELVEAAKAVIHDPNTWSGFADAALRKYGKPGYLSPFMDIHRVSPLPFKSVDDPYDVLLAMGIDKKQIKFSKQESKKLIKDIEKLSELTKGFGRGYLNIKKESGMYVSGTRELKKYPFLYTIIEDWGAQKIGWETFVERLTVRAKALDQTKLTDNKKVVKMIRDYIDPIKRNKRTELDKKINTFLSPTFESIYTKPLPNINISQNIINRMIAEAKDKELSKVKFLIGKNTSESERYLDGLARSREVQKNYETTIAGQVIATAKKIGATYDWDEVGYLTITLPEKEFTLPMFKNQGGKVIRSLQRTRNLRSI